MNINRVYAVYFSPCGNVKKTVIRVALGICASLGVMSFQEFDITEPQNRERIHGFKTGDVVIFGMPVFAGRIPNKLLPYVQEGFVGSDTLLVPVVSYGNRSFDDALAELSGELKKKGFHTVAAAAVPGQHSFSQTLATGRPNAEDLDALMGFGKEKGRMIKEAKGIKELKEPPIPGSFPSPAYYRPLQADGSPAMFLKAVPGTHRDQCTSCGVCVRHCPMGVIDVRDNITITGTCIKCHACVNVCPEGAKYFDDPQLLSHIEMLKENYSDKKRDLLLI